MIRGFVVGFTTYHQAAFCSHVGERFGWASFLFVLFFCMLANSLAVHWWRGRHG